MLVKDQLKIRMEQLEMPVSELAKRVGVSGQSVRHWLVGRSFPGKAKCNLIEEALSFKLDFSEGESMQSITVEQTLKQSSVNTLLAISKLPLEVQLLFAKLASAYADLQIKSADGTTTYLDAKTSAPAQEVKPIASAAKVPPHPANHGRAVGRISRKVASH